MDHIGNEGGTPGSLVVVHPPPARRPRPLRQRSRRRRSRRHWLRRQPPSPPRRRGLPTAALLVVVSGALGVGVLAVGTTPGVPHQGRSVGISVAGVAARVAPDLVDVDTRLAFAQGSSAGTGMVISRGGLVVTNNHVIEDETSLRVTDVGNGRIYGATVVGYDVDADVAVLRLLGASSLRTVAFARGGAHVGEPVVAVGNARGKGGTPSASPGTVMALDRSITAGSDLSHTVEHLSGLLETDALVESGDSGGPLATRTATVLGMDTAFVGGTNATGWNGRGYAIPAATVRRVADAIVSGVRAPGVHLGTTAFLGTEVAGIGTGGAAVTQVEPGSPAAKAGIMPGDVLVSLAGRPVHTPTTLSSLLLGERPGARVPLQWQDPSARLHEATVTLGSGPPA